MLCNGGAKAGQAERQDHGYSNSAESTHGISIHEPSPCLLCRDSDAGQSRPPEPSPCNYRSIASANERSLIVYPLTMLAQSYIASAPSGKLRIPVIGAERQVPAFERAHECRVRQAVCGALPSAAVAPRIGANSDTVHLSAKHSQPVTLEAKLRNQEMTGHTLKGEYWLETYETDLSAVESERGTGISAMPVPGVDVETTDRVDAERAAVAPCRENGTRSRRQ